MNHASLVLVIAAISASSCKDDFNELRRQNVNGGRDLSIFQIYASKYCKLGDEGDTRQLKVDCSRLGEFVEPGSDYCAERDGFMPYQASFPDQDRAMRVCRDLANGARQDQQRVTFLAFADVGAGEEPDKGTGQVQVAQAMNAICPPRATHPSDDPNALRCDFAIISGDLIYPRGVSSVFDPLLTSRFEEPYAPFGTFDFYMLPGNHDYFGSIKSQIEYSWFSDRWRMPAAHYPIPDLPSWLHMYGLDTTAMADDDEHADVADTTTEQMQALESGFCGKDGWRLLAGHHPPFSNGKHGGTETIATKIGRLYDKCPFDLYISGHDHHQEHISTDRFEIMIQGAGGAEIKNVTISDAEATGRLGDRPDAKYSQKFARSVHGFAVVDATPETIDVRFYDVEKWTYAAGIYTQTPDPTQFIYHCRMTRDAPSHACVPVTAGEE